MNFSEVFDDPRTEICNCLAVCHVDRIRACTVWLQRIYLTCGRLRIRICAAHYRDVGSFVCESQSDRLANASAVACYDSHLIHKSIHQASNEREAPRQVKGKLPVSVLSCQWGWPSARSSPPQIQKFRIFSYKPSINRSPCN